MVKLKMSCKSLLVNTQRIRLLRSHLKAVIIGHIPERDILEGQHVAVIQSPAVAKVWPQVNVLLSITIITYLPELPTSYLVGLPTSYLPESPTSCLAELPTSYLAELPTSYLPEIVGRKHFPPILVYPEQHMSTVVILM